MMKTSMGCWPRSPSSWLAVAAPAAARGPQSPYVRSLQELVLKDGSRAYGAVVAEDATDIVFRTSSGAELKTPKARIASLRPVTGRMVGGEFRREDPNGTRLAFGPTARAVPRGQAYLAVYQGIVPFVQVGVTDRFSIGGGTPLVFAFDDWDRRTGYPRNCRCIPAKPRPRPWACSTRLPATRASGSPTGSTQGTAARRVHARGGPRLQR